MIKFFAGSLEQIEKDFNAFEKTVSVSETALTLKPSGEGVLAVRYSECLKSSPADYLEVRNGAVGTFGLHFERPEPQEPPKREFPKPNAAGFFNSKDIYGYLKDIETEVKGYIKEIKAGKTLKGFDRDSGTYLECYKMHDQYYLGTFVEGVNSDHEMRELEWEELEWQELDCSDRTLCKHILKNCGLYPEFKIE